MRHGKGVLRAIRRTEEAEHLKQLLAGEERRLRRFLGGSTWVKVSNLRNAATYGLRLSIEHLGREVLNLNETQACRLRDHLNKHWPPAETKP